MYINLKEPTKLKNRPICVDRNWYQPHSYQPLYFIASTIFLTRSGKSLDDETTTTGNAQEEQQLQPQQQTSKEILNLQFKVIIIYIRSLFEVISFLFSFFPPLSVLGCLFIFRWFSECVPISLALLWRFEYFCRFVLCRQYIRKKRTLLELIVLNYIFIFLKKKEGLVGDAFFAC